MVSLKRLAAASIPLQAVWAAAASPSAPQLEYAFTIEVDLHPAGQPLVSLGSNTTVLLASQSTISGPLLNATYVSGLFYLTNYNTTPHMVSYSNEWVYKTDDGELVRGYESTAPIDGTAFLTNFVTHPIITAGGQYQNLSSTAFVCANPIPTPTGNGGLHSVVECWAATGTS